MRIFIILCGVIFFISSCYNQTEKKIHSKPEKKKNENFHTQKNLVKGKIDSNKPKIDSKKPKIDSNKPKISPDIKPFLEKYFSTWSNRDLESYKSCFHETAVIIQITKGKVKSSIDLEEFIFRQENYFAKARGPVVEKMTSFTVDEDEYSATVGVNWILQRDGISWTGVDRFSLIRDKNGEWKIVALLWYKNK